MAMNRRLAVSRANSGAFYPGNRERQGENYYHLFAVEIQRDRLRRPSIT
jgi:hypothetical protein